MSDDLNLRSLIGKTVRSAKINEDKNFLVLNTDDETFYVTWTGDCCAKCYLANIEGSEYLIDAKINNVSNSEWEFQHNEEEFEAIDSMGSQIKTTKGYVTLETRVEHNGFYGGQINVSNETPIGQYGYPMFEDSEMPKLTPLKDF